MKIQLKGGWLGLVGLCSMLSCSLPKPGDMSQGQGTSAAMTSTLPQSSAPGASTLMPTTGQSPTTGVTSTGPLTSSAFPETTTQSPGTSSGQSTGVQPKEPRDCSKIKWGEGRLKEGAIIARGDVKGYIDGNGDGLIEEKLRDAGMCQMHLSGKRCGLMVYGRWG